MESNPEGDYCHLLHVLEITVTGTCLNLNLRSGGLLIEISCWTIRPKNLVVLAKRKGRIEEECRTRSIVLLTT